MDHIRAATRLKWEKEEENTESEPRPTSNRNETDIIERQVVNKTTVPLSNSDDSFNVPVLRDRSLSIQLGPQNNSVHTQSSPHWSHGAQCAHRSFQLFRNDRLRTRLPAEPNMESNELAVHKFIQNFVF